MRRKDVPLNTKAKKIYTTFQQYLQYETLTLKWEEELIKNYSLETESMKNLISESDQIHQKLLQQVRLLNDQIEEEANQISLMIECHKEASRFPKLKREQMMQCLVKNAKSCRNIRQQKERTSSQQIFADIELRQQEAIFNRISLEKQEIMNKKQIHKEGYVITDKQIDKQKANYFAKEKEFQDLFVLKKRFNNELQQLKGNIRVYCRIRPAHSEVIAIQPTSDITLKLTLSKQNVKSENQKYDQTYAFDFIFGPTQSQQTIFTETSQLVLNAIDGNNVCIFAYGQTGSGKTYTLHGLDEEFVGEEKQKKHRGLTSRSIDVIFEEIYNNARLKWTYRLFLSIQEIYLETIRDLITKEIVEMNNHEERQVFSPQDIQSILRQAKLNRKIASTNCNQRSSRSHLIVTIRIQGHNQVSSQTRNGSLVLVDLAGSERLKQSKAEGLVLKETQFINKSLSCLGNVINGLKNKSEHIPYRNSKLTHSLQRYLGGENKTLMFVNVSPDEEDAPQTKISLSFAESARQAKSNLKR